MDENDHGDVVRRFWQRMQSVVGVIPERVIALMDLLELSASEALTMDRDWGATILEDIRLEGEGIYKDAVARKKVPANRTKYTIFGRHQDDLANFRLTGAEESSINSIARIVREHGIAYFITEQQPGRLPERIPAASAAGPPDLQVSLRDRLNDYFNGKPEYFGVNAFANLAIEIESRHPNQDKVRAKCLRCPNTIRCTRTRNVWHISNYTQHVKRKHKPRATDGPIFNRTRSKHQLPPQDSDDSEVGEVEETFTTASSTGDDTADYEGSTESVDEEEDGVNEEDEENEEDGENEEDAVAHTVTELDTATEQAGDGTVQRSRVSTLVNLFSAGPSTSYQRTPKN